VPVPTPPPPPFLLFMAAVNVGGSMVCEGVWVLLLLSDTECVGLGEGEAEEFLSRVGLEELEKLPNLTSSEGDKEGDMVSDFVVSCVDVPPPQREGVEVGVEEGVKTAVMERDADGETVGVETPPALSPLGDLVA